MVWDRTQPSAYIIGKLRISPAVAAGIAETFMNFEDMLEDSRLRLRANSSRNCSTVDFDVPRSALL